MGPERSYYCPTGSGSSRENSNNSLPPFNISPNLYTQQPILTSPAPPDQIKNFVFVRSLSFFNGTIPVCAFSCNTLPFICINSFHIDYIAMTSHYCLFSDVQYIEFFVQNSCHTNNTDMSLTTVCFLMRNIVIFWEKLLPHC
ncbi:unnamed protein product, partial [Meganyctiphanes norvegica]